jgi:hypothetical protein
MQIRLTAGHPEDHEQRRNKVLGELGFKARREAGMSDDAADDRSKAHRG